MAATLRICLVLHIEQTEGGDGFYDDAGAQLIGKLATVIGTAVGAHAVARLGKLRSAVSPGGVLGDLLAWGTDGDGEAFCCSLSAGPNCTMSVYGTLLADDLAFFTSSPSNDLSCNANNVYADEGDDYLGGSRLASVLEYLDGGAGNDTINGNGGDDSIDGDAGNDYITGDDGDDDVRGGSGNDTVWAGEGDDVVDGQDGDDDLHGGAGADTLSGYAGSDLVCGGFGEDTLDGETDDDFVFGGPGDDLSNDGSGGTDYCENATTVDGCEFTSLTSCTRSP